MNLYKFITVSLIALGIVGIAYGGFAYTRETWNVLTGPLNLTVDSNEFVNNPVWISAAAILIGLVLYFRAKELPVTAVLAPRQRRGR